MVSLKTKGDVYTKLTKLVDAFVDSGKYTGYEKPEELFDKFVDWVKNQRNAAED